MIQMLNVDLKKTYHGNEDYSDNEDFRRSQTNNKKLAPIDKNKMNNKRSKEKTIDVNNISADNINVDDHMRPKITKIYKKNKIEIAK